MPTPAVDISEGPSNVYVPGETLRWWGEWQSQDQLDTLIVRRQKRPASVSAGKHPDGSWRRSAWQHYWFRLSGIPMGYTFRASSGGYTYGVRSDSGHVVLGGPFLLAQVAPYVERPTAPRTAEMWNLENLTRTRILNKLREENVDLGVALGEIHQTYGFLADACHATLNGVEALRRKSRMSVRDIQYWLYNGFDKTPPWHRRRPQREKIRLQDGANFARDMWLQQEFALKPFLDDIQESAISLDKYVNGRSVPEKTVTVRSGASTERFEEIVLRHSSMGGWFGYPVTCLVTTEVHGSASWEVPVSFARTFESLGLGNPASLAWELTPFSWMWDYFNQTGSWLSSMSADRGATYLDGSLSFIQRVQFVNDSVSGRLEPGATIVEMKPRVMKPRLDAGRFEREVLANGFLPAILPPMRNRMNLHRFANSFFALTKSYGPNLRI